MFASSNTEDMAMTSIGLALPVFGRRIGVRRMVARLAGRWQQARQLRAARRYLMEMDDHTLADIGASRAQALFQIDQAIRRGGE